MIKKKKQYPRIRAFFATMGICFLICFMIMGMALVFMRTENILSDEPKQVFAVVQKNGICEVTVFGEVYRTEVPEDEKDGSPFLYALIPPEIRVMCGLVELALGEE